MTTVIDFTAHRVKKLGEDKHYIERLDEAYERITQYFMEMLQSKYSKDDVGVLAMIKFTADVVRVGRDRPACGEEWAKDMVEIFVKRSNKPWKSEQKDD